MTSLFWLVQGVAQNNVRVERNHSIAIWIKDVYKTLAKSGRDRALWPDFIKPAPNPTLHGANTDFSLIGSKAVFWDPVLLWGEAALPACTACLNCDGRGQRDGPGKIRKVCGLDTTYFIVATKYRHRNCPGDYCSLNAAGLQL